MSPASPRQDPAASRAIDAIVEAPGDWRSTTLDDSRCEISPLPVHCA